MKKLLIFCLLLSIFCHGCGGGGSSSATGTSTGTGGGGTPPSGSTPEAVGVPQSMVFVSASPTHIGLKGMAGVGIPETSIVTFKVIDTNKIGVSGQTVDFSLNTSIGGLALVSQSGVTSTDGTVSTIVQAGIFSTSVKVTAAVRGTSPSISTQSDSLVVSTGVAAQDGFSISIETLNAEAWNIDGVKDIVTARLSDHFHNPVPDGTSVYFTTSGGSIQPSCQTGLNQDGSKGTPGTCSVTWTSQNPRPIMPGSLTGLPSTGAKLDGRAVILAYAVGEEAFVDSNGNGVADPGEFTDTTGAFRDDNENGVLNTNEPFIPFLQTGVFDQKDGHYNGVLQNAADIAANVPRSKHVFSNTALVMSTSVPGKVAFTPADVGVATTVTIVNPGPPVTSTTTTIPTTTVIALTVADGNGNVMPAGTTVSVAGDGNSLTSSFSSVVANTNAVGGSDFSVPITCNSTISGSGAVTVTITTPSGVKSIFTKTITFN
jgi:hypothetical protein